MAVLVENYARPARPGRPQSPVVRSADVLNEQLDRKRRLAPGTRTDVVSP